jgi:sialate O-acetylesterase
MIHKSRFHLALLSLAALGLCAAPFARADVRLPALFSDNMVLQQGMEVPVWGWASDGEQVTVTFRGQTAKTVAKDGKWMVKLKKLKAGGPDELTVKGNNSLMLKNVLVGEVWICSGQSNMEFPLRQSFESKADVDASANPQIHLFHVPKMKADAPKDDVKASWTACDPDTVTGFSAVGYYFARSLQKDRGVPLGMIETDWGGSPAEVWMKQEALESNPRYKREILDAYVGQRKSYDDALAAFEKERDEAKAANKPFNKRSPGAPWKPTELYNGMIAPLVHYAIKGAIWYQGESNAGRAEQYRSLFADMIRNWRNDWNEGDFTFLCVQLAPYMAVKEQPGESAWAELREAQWLSTKVLPNAGMAVITDVGDPKDIHPTKKKPVGERLAIAARGIAYGENIEYSGPIYHSMMVKDDNKATITFDHVGKGLEGRDGELKGFAVCGDDKKWVWAKAEIKGKKQVVVSAPEVAHPVAVRFGWADCPVVNLWNKDGLPASPFRTDDFPMITAPKK